MTRRDWGFFMSGYLLAVVVVHLVLMFSGATP